MGSQEETGNLAAYEVTDAVQGGTILVTTLSAGKLHEMIIKVRNAAPCGWTQEDLLTGLIKLAPNKIRVALAYSGEEIELVEGGQQTDPLLYIDGRISLNGVVDTSYSERTIQKLVETDHLARSIATQAKKRQEEKAAKPSLTAIKIIMAKKLEEKSVEAKRVLPLQAIQINEKPNKSVLDRTFNAVKKLANKNVF